MPARVKKKPSIQASAAPKEHVASSSRERLEAFWLGQLDLAPVCLFRIIFGLSLLSWFWQFGPDLREFFTDEGLLPRSSYFTFFRDRFSLLYLVGDWWQLAIFWALSLVVAVLVTIGYRTRLACGLAFLAVISFQQRNPLIWDGSDFVFRMVPFWLMFTAAGNRFSLDAAVRRARGESLSSFGPALPIRILQLQIAWIYLASGLEKLAGWRWLDGTAAYYALQLRYTYGRAYAEPLAHFEPFMRAASWGTLALELGFLPAVFSPFFQPFLRHLAIIGAAMLHYGILMLMDLGNFPLIMLATLVVFFPPSVTTRLVDAGCDLARSLAGSVPVFSRLEKQIHRFAGRQVLAAGGGAETPRQERARAAFTGASAGGDRSVAERSKRWTAPACVAFCLIAVVAFATAMPKPLAWKLWPPVAGLARFASLDQLWDMFSPDPTRVDGWMRAPGKLADGTTVELVDEQGRPRPDSPRVVSEPIDGGPPSADPPYNRWTKLHERIELASYNQYRLEYARMYCRIGNSDLRPRESPLEAFDLYYTERTIQPPGQGPPTTREHHIWSHRC